MAKDLLSTGELVAEISHDLNHSLILGLTLGPDNDLTKMLHNPSFVDHSLSLIFLSWYHHRYYLLQLSSSCLFLLRSSTVLSSRTVL
jgi:hypothetical protein